MEKVPVIVEGVSSSINQQISGKMTEDIEVKDAAANGHYEFLADGRLVTSQRPTQVSPTPSNLSRQHL
jgi:hypothetical protein